MSYKNKVISRGNSICPSPAEILLKAVEINEIEEIEEVLSKNEGLVNEVYEDREGKPILMIACHDFNEKIEPKTVKCLLEKGADVKFEKNNWMAIHFAIYYDCFDVFKTILKVEPKSIHIETITDNLLHFVIKEIDEDQSLRYIEELLEKGINVNHVNCKNFTPIYFAAKKKYKKVVALLLDTRDNVSLSEEVRSLISANNLYNLENYASKESEDSPTLVKLLEYIQSGDGDKFKAVRNIQEFVEGDNGQTTLLQRCCEMNRREIFDYLLEKKANPILVPAKVKNQKPPIVIALERSGIMNDFHIFDKLKEIYVRENEQIPNRVWETLAKTSNSEFQKRFSELLTLAAGKEGKDKKEIKKSKILDVNYINEDGNNLIHFASKYSTQSNVLKLLNLGNSMAVMNKFGFMPVRTLKPETLERHLDSCIVKTDESDRKLEVIINFKTLLVPTETFKEETEKLQIEELDHEEKPLKTNWQHVRHNAKSFNPLPETDMVLFLSKSSKFKHLLNHPVIVTYLLIKWHQIRWWFRINVAFYVTYLLSLIFYILYSYANFKAEITNVDNAIGKFSHILLCLTFTLLILRELFQFTISPGRYIRNYENYLELTTILLTFVILAIGDPAPEFRKQISSVTILVAAFALILLVGQHPKLSTNVEILKQVLLNFFNLLLWYSILIIAFVLSFYLMFADTQENPEENSFRDPGQSFFKTIIMITGEFDASSIHFNTVLSKIIFCLFIFMISIILINLLNGLAVSDIQAIKSDCELVAHIARARYIGYAEGMMRGKLIPKRMLHYVLDLFCCCSISERLKASSLASINGTNTEVTVDVFSNGLIKLEGKSEHCYQDFCSLYLDEESVKRIESIIDTKQMHEYCKRCQQRLGYADIQQ